MKSLFIEFSLRARIQFYELALQQIEPTHEDVPGIVLTLLHLTDRLDGLKGQQ